mmetsp:Transcript_4335/g.12143  ORF Transcript_4335/g.12143 Transcript_4335/m.12143 type:complete len:87 (-) Transcript_4335:3448-3708(-)
MEHLSVGWRETGALLPRPEGNADGNVSLEVTKVEEYAFEGRDKKGVAFPGPFAFSSFTAVPLLQAPFLVSYIYNLKFGSRCVFSFP